MWENNEGLGKKRGARLKSARTATGLNTVICSVRADDRVNVGLSNESTHYHFRQDAMNSHKVEHLAGSR